MKAMTGAIRQPKAKPDRPGLNPDTRAAIECCMYRTGELDKRYKCGVVLPFRGHYDARTGGHVYCTRC
jgi:hypothetical protein